MGDKFENDHSKILNNILDEVRDTRKSVYDLDKKVDLHIQETKFELSNIHQQDQHQNKLLDEHIEGVKTLKQWCDDHAKENEKRFDKLEAPRKWFKMTKSGVLWVSSVSGGALMIIKLLRMLGKL